MSLLFALLPAVLLAPVPKDLEAQIKWRLAKGDVFYVSMDDRSGRAWSRGSTRIQAA